MKKTGMHHLTVWESSFFHEVRYHSDTILEAFTGKFTSSRSRKHELTLPQTVIC